jgi:hypothetical protein
MIAEQMRQLNLQQQYLYSMSQGMAMNVGNGKAGINPYFNPNEVLSNENKGTTPATNNPGFQMNPVSKNKKYK